MPLQGGKGGNGGGTHPPSAATDTPRPRSRACKAAVQDAARVTTHGRAALHLGRALSLSRHFKFELLEWQCSGSDTGSAVSTRDHRVRRRRVCHGRYLKRYSCVRDRVREGKRAQSHKGVRVYSGYR